jgi:hypothetical protein
MMRFGVFFLHGVYRRPLVYSMDGELVMATVDSGFLFSISLSLSLSLSLCFFLLLLRGRLKRV